MTGLRSRCMHSGLAVMCGVAAGAVTGDLPVAGAISSAMTSPATAAAEGAARAETGVRLPMRSEGTLRGLPIAASVEIVRDGLGIPAVRAESYEDAVFAQGFLHAQERFFQMDLSRRMAAGRLCELAGALTLASDRTYRMYRFTHLAERVLEGLPADQRQLLLRYAEGVNAGLQDLTAPPREYAILAVPPEPWNPIDTILVQCTFAIGLGGSNDMEIHRGIAARTLPAALYDFLMEDGRRFEAPMLRADALSEAPPIPGPEVVDLRAAANGDEGARIAERDADAAEGVEAVAPNVVVADAPAAEDDSPFAGFNLFVDPPHERRAAASNNWAMAGWRTAHGGAILAGDPHLQLAMPNTWYRMELYWEDRKFVGASLPGSPGIFFGSNGHVAYAFTNASVDVQDFVLVEMRPGDRSRYRGASGDWQSMEIVKEQIRVRGGATVELEVRMTEFGPIVRDDARGRPMAHRWTAADPSIVNIDVLRLVDARTLEEALTIGAGWHGPPQNLVVAASDGRVGWVLTGWLPRRVGMDGTIPMQWTRDVGWAGALAEELRPRLIDPPSGVVFTANNRTVGGAHGDLFGRQFAPGVRAQRIAHVLAHGAAWDEEAMLDLQLDTEVALLEPYRRILVSTLRAAGGEPDLAFMREEALAWNGTADASERGLAAIDAFRRDVRSALVDALTIPCRTLDPGFRASAMMSDAPLLAILESHPEHLVPPEFDTWFDFLIDSARRVGSRFSAADRGGRRVPLWGDAQRLRIAHPLSMVGMGPPPLPDHPIDGHPHAVRVVTPGFGATLRIVVSPGRESQGIFHMPGGQSGHWDSPHFADGHWAWLEGAPTPLLAGAPQGSFRMEP